MEWIGNIETRGSAPCSRKGHTMTRLLDSSLVLVFGGESSDGDMLNDMYSLHVERMEWRKLIYKEGPVPCPRLLHSATAISSTAMVVMFGDAFVRSEGKDGYTSPLKDVWVFDVRDCSWKEISSKDKGPPARSCHTAVFGNGLGQVPAVYVFGGFGGGSSCGSMTYRLRIGDWEWEKLSILFKDTSGGEIIVTEPEKKDTGEGSDVVGSQYSDYPRPRESHGAVWLPGLNGMLVIGGDGGYTLQDDCWFLVPALRHRGVWRWRQLKLRAARNMPKNQIPPCAGFSLIALPTEKTQVLLWGGIHGAGGSDTMAPKESFLIDVDSKQSTFIVAKGEAPKVGRLLHGFVRANDHLIAFGGCDGTGNVMTGLEMAKVFPDFKSVGLQATDFGPVAAGVAAGADLSKTEEGSTMTSNEKRCEEGRFDNAEEVNIPLVGPSSIPQGTPLSGRILDVSDYGYFVSVIIKGRLYKGVLVANPLKKSDDVEAVTAHDTQEKDNVGLIEENDGTEKPEPRKLKRPRLDPLVDALPDSPERPKLKPEIGEVIELDL